MTAVQRFWVSVILLAFLVTLLPAQESEAASECPDANMYQTELSEARVRLERAGLVNAVVDPTASRLRPGPEPVIRARVAHALAKALGQDEFLSQAAEGAPFADLAGHWAAPAIALLAREGIVRGYPDGTFRPNRIVTLPEVQLMLARLLRLGQDLTLANAEDALQGAGVWTAVPCPEPNQATEWHVLLLLDRALSASIYDRHSVLETERFIITARPDKFPNCPDPQRLVPTESKDHDAITALLPEIVPLLYRAPQHRRYEVGMVARAADAGVRGEHVTVWCRPEVAASTWVVGLTFPDFAPSASLSSGLFYVAKEQNRWNV